MVKKKTTNRRPTLTQMRPGNLSLAVLRVELQPVDNPDDLDIEEIQQMWIDAINQEVRERKRSVADIICVMHDGPLTLNTRVYLWLKQRRRK